jgi:hypothetical protein
VSREAFLEIMPIGEIQELLFDSRDASRNVEPIQTMLAFLPKPGAYYPSQSIFAIRQDPQIRVLSTTAAPVSLNRGLPGSAIYDLSTDRHLIPNWAKDQQFAYRTINARAETVDKALPAVRHL